MGIVFIAVADCGIVLKCHAGLRKQLRNAVIAFAGNDALADGLRQRNAAEPFMLRASTALRRS